MLQLRSERVGVTAASMGHGHASAGGALLDNCEVHDISLHNVLLPPGLLVFVPLPNLASSCLPLTKNTSQQMLVTFSAEGAAFLESWRLFVLILPLRVSFDRSR